jgi:hypothetical protein
MEIGEWNATGIHPRKLHLRIFIRKFSNDRCTIAIMESHIQTYLDIFHYQKIIVALTQTDRIMKEIDEVIPEVGYTKP